jgi:hypothetical protein
MFRGANPYGPETTLKIQEVVYGGPALGEDPMMFVYPAWMFVLIAPFSLIPFKWSAILYIGSLLWAMLNFLYFIALRLGNTRFLLSVLWFVLLLLGSLPFLVISVTKGQLGYFSLLMLFIAYQLSKRQPLLAGVILSFALIKPTVTVIPVAGFLLWAFFKKDLKFLAGFVGCISLLFVTSYLAVGNWLPDYFDMLSVTGGMPVLWSLAILPLPWNILYASIFIGTGLFAFYSSYRNGNELWFPALVLLGIALTPMRWIYDLFLGILILTNQRSTSKLLSLILGVTILSPWILIFFPELLRWSVAIIGIPLMWLMCLLVFLQESYIESEIK